LLASTKSVTRSVVGASSQGFLLGAANLAGMDRAKAEAIYDGGRKACVQFILDLAGRLQQLEDRL
jgi:hypothetical protein